MVTISWFCNQVNEIKIYFFIGGVWGVGCVNLTRFREDCIRRNNLT